MMQLTQKIKKHLFVFYHHRLIVEQPKDKRQKEKRERREKEEEDKKKRKKCRKTHISDMQRMSDHDTNIKVKTT